MAVREKGGEGKSNKVEVSAKRPRSCPGPGPAARPHRAPRPLTCVRQSGEYMTAAGGCGRRCACAGERRERGRGGERGRERKKKERERGEEGEPRACFLLSHFQLCQTAASAEPLHELNFNPASTFPHYALGMPAPRSVKGIAPAAPRCAALRCAALRARSAPAPLCTARGGGEGRGGGCGATASLRPAARGAKFGCGREEGGWGGTSTAGCGDGWGQRERRGRRNFAGALALVVRCLVRFENKNEN